MAIFEEVYEDELVKAAPEDLQAFKEIEKDLRKQIENLLKFEFKDLNRQNADSFADRASLILNAIDNYTKENEYDINVWLKKAYESEKLAEKKGIPRTDPYYSALKTTQESVRNFSNSIKLRALAIWLYDEMTKRYLEMIKQVKNIEFEKQRLETSKTIYDDIIVKMREDHKTTIEYYREQNLSTMKRYEDVIDGLRKDLKETMDMINKKDKSLEILRAQLQGTVLGERHVRDSPVMLEPRE